MREGKWYEADNAKFFSYGLPMSPYLFYGTQTTNIFYAGEPNSDLSLRKFAYTKYKRSDTYSSINIFGLIEESFISDTNANTFDAVALDKRWQWTQHSAKTKVDV